MNTERHTYRNQLASLYNKDELKALHQSRGTNAGLWLDKYIKDQDYADSKERDATESKEQNRTKSSNRSALVAEVATIPIPGIYKQFYGRWQQVLASYGVPHEQTRLAKTKGRMVIGLGDESVLETSIALHHTYGVPYIPGSALKGLAASYARQRLEAADWGKESEAYKVIFGETEEAGFITFFDALLHIDDNSEPDQPGASVLRRDTITVHHPGYYQGDKKNATPSDWDSPTPIPFLSATGSYLLALAAPDLENGQQWIRRVFKILRYALAEVGIGAKTSSGYGRMILETREEDDAPEEEEEIAVTPEPAWESLLKRINKSSWSYDLFAAWEQLPPEDDGTIKVAQALVEKVENVAGKKRSPKDEKRYQRLLQYLAQHTQL